MRLARVLLSFDVFRRKKISQMIFAVMCQDAPAAGEWRALADRSEKRSGQRVFCRQDFLESLHSLAPLGAI